MPRRGKAAHHHRDERRTALQEWFGQLVIADFNARACKKVCDDAGGGTEQQQLELVWCIQHAIHLIDNAPDGITDEEVRRLLEEPAPEPRWQRRLEKSWKDGSAWRDILAAKRELETGEYSPRTLEWILSLPPTHPARLTLERHRAAGTFKRSTEDAR